MRHLLANIITYTIAVLLFVGAAAFAWMRSSQLTLGNEQAHLARWEPTGTADFDWREPGAAGYARNCRACHGPDGRGRDQYPPLDDAAPVLDAVDGRAHLIDVMLYGLASERWGAPMPPMGHMQDVEIAAVLNYTIVTFLRRPAEPPILPADVAARRGQGLRPADVARVRSRR